MPTYRKADREDVALLDEVMREHHPKLVESGVRVGLLYANAPTDEKTGLPKGHALKLHGYPCLAIVRIASVRDRVQGKPDASIELDHDSWPSHSHETKRAILDHELTHLVLATDRDGNLKVDDANRPALKMRPHDVICGGFQETALRHGKHAPESQQYVEAHRFFSQSIFPWG